MSTLTEQNGTRPWAKFGTRGEGRGGEGTEGKHPLNELHWWVCEGVVLNNLLIDSLGIDS